MQHLHGLPQEDGVFETRMTTSGPVHTTIAIVGNHDEFEPMRHIPGVHLVWARNAAQINQADWVILPGSKATAADLQWMRSHGLDDAVTAHAHAGQRVLGI